MEIIPIFEPNLYAVRYPDNEYDEFEQLFDSWIDNTQMTMATKLQDILQEMASGNSSHWEEKALWRKENEAWLNKSASIALKVLRALRKQSMTQKELAERIGVSPQQVNKLLKGEENMCLDTICKLEAALGIKLITIPNLSSGESIFSKKDSPAVSHPKKYTISVESDNVCESVNEQDMDK